MSQSKIIIAGLILFSAILSVGVVAVFGFPLVGQSAMDQPSAETEPTPQKPTPNPTPIATATATPTRTPRPTPTPLVKDWPTKENPCQPIPKDAPEATLNGMEAENITWRMDEDGDRLSDYCEKNVISTKYDSYDTDRDGLGDFREYYNTSTSPTNPDMDNDGIPDGIEVRGEYAGTEMEGLDPMSADLVLVVYPSYFADSDEITNATIEEMEREWANLRIQNPDGSTGVDLHVIRKEHRLPGVDWGDLESVLSNDPHEDVKGIISVSIADLDDTQQYGYAYKRADVIRIDSEKNKKFTLTHETLHIIVGILPDHLQGGAYEKRYHMYEGYLSTDVIGTQDYFPRDLEEYMNSTVYGPKSR